MSTQTQATTRKAPDSRPVDPTVIATSPRRTKFYIVDEAERASRRPTPATDGRTAVLINGRWHALRGKTATFDQLLGIAFPDKALAVGQPTVTFQQVKPHKRVGTLNPGDAVPLTEGLRINANATYAS